MRYTLSIYGDEALKAKFERVKEAQKEKNPGVPMSDSTIGGIVIDEAFQKILGKQTNTNRITTIIERLDSLEATEATGNERLTALELVIRELIDIVKGNQS